MRAANSPYVMPRAFNKRFNVSTSVIACGMLASLRHPVADINTVCP
jgi:hypothetical protein